MKPIRIAILGVTQPHGLGYIDTLAQLGAPADASGASGSLSLRLRADVVEPSLPRDTVLANAPEAAAGYVRVPPILE